MTTQETLPRFYLPVRVRFADTDMQGHVFFGNYFTYMDEAFMAYIDALGFSWQTLGKMERAIFYVDSGCQFKTPSYFGDRLKVHTRISALGKRSLTAEMIVVRDGDQAVQATGYLKGVMVDTRMNKSTRIPDAFREAVKKYQT
jgi:acyl-CoA thioester hydrolase